MVLPSFIGIGTTRAGSTWLHRNLSDHPEIFVPWAKELHYFDVDENYQRGTSFYEENFRKHLDKRAVGEITPSYLHIPTVPERIKQLLPTVKLLCCLRNPVERAYSHYWRSIAVAPAGTPRVDFFEQVQNMPDIVETGYYAKHIKRYLNSFDRDQLHIFLFDDIANAPESLLTRVFGFLEVDMSVRPAYAQNQINAGASLGNLARSEYLNTLMKIVKRFGSAGASLENKLEKLNRSQIPKMDPNIQQYLVGLYSQDVRELEDLIETDLSAWKIE